VLLTSPDVPVHAITTVYEGRRWGRKRVTVRISPRLAVDPRTMDAEALTQIVTRALVELGDLPYEHAFARTVKAARDLDDART